MKQTETPRSLLSSVLVLNRAYVAIHVVNVRRAFGLLCRNLAEVIDLDDGQYANYDFESWLLVSDVRADGLTLDDDDWSEDWIRSVNFSVLVPRVIRLYAFDRIPKHSLRFNRRNLFARDGHRCQYCGHEKPLSQLSVDHVQPRSRGGDNSWENTVCCCVSCNTRKGSKTPVEAQMRLISQPKKPRFNPLLARKLDNPKYECWRTFLKAAGYSVEVA